MSNELIVRELMQRAGLLNGNGRGLRDGLGQYAKSLFNEVSDVIRAIEGSRVSMNTQYEIKRIVEEKLIERFRELQ